jgi:hypothetical protein
MGMRELMIKMMAGQGQAQMPGNLPQMPQQPPVPVGSGMAQQAAQIIQSRPYQLHVQEAQAMGQQPMPPEQFIKMMQGQPR